MRCGGLVLAWGRRQRVKFCRGVGLRNDDQTRPSYYLVRAVAATSHSSKERALVSCLLKTIQCEVLCHLSN